MPLFFIFVSDDLLGIFFSSVCVSAECLPPLSEALLWSPSSPTDQPTSCHDSARVSQRSPPDQEAYLGVLP